MPVRIFATRQLLEAVMDDKSLEQAVNAATLPGLVGHVLVMPDMHQGYGFPIGGVAATRYPDGVISPGAIGYDINCGVRLLASRSGMKMPSDHTGRAGEALNHYCPSGVGTKGHGAADEKPSWIGVPGGQPLGAEAGLRLPEPTCAGRRKPAAWRAPIRPR